MIQSIFTSDKRQSVSFIPTPPASFILPTSPTPASHLALLSHLTTRSLLPLPHHLHPAARSPAHWTTALTLCRLLC
ncbi:hypothetical protein E2C01_037005 [Portunus trituberculatus]|uniref:Uncharacterized protein n=1 Tax=Portunus trituberculatus TaxID=210409 RepID=A0A5B7F703_PORTR|nr:hypothetical protein [Portunus trituberculatus]